MEDKIVGFGQDPDFPSVAAGDPVRESDLYNQYDHALVITVIGASYEDSVKVVKQIADGIGQEGENISVADYEHDNSGQRVVYLHPEESDNTWEPK